MSAENPGTAGPPEPTAPAVPVSPRPGRGRGARYTGSYRELARLLGYAKPYLLVVGIALGFSVLYSGGLTGRAALLGPLLDDVVVPQAADLSLTNLDDAVPSTPDTDADRARMLEKVQENFQQILLAGISLVFLMPLTRVVRDYACDWLTTRLQVDLQATLGEKLLRLPLAHHQRERGGDFIARLQSDTSVASRAQMVVFSDAVQNITTVVVAVGALLYLNWQLSLMALLVGPPIAVVLRVFGRKIRKAAGARQEQVSEVSQRLVQILTGIKVIKAFHAESHERDLFGREIARYFKRSMRVVRNRVYSRALVEFVSQGSFIAVLFVGIWAVVNQFWGLSTGQLVAFITISAMLYRPLKASPTVFNAVQDALPAACRVFEVLDAPEVPADREGARDLPVLRESIRYEGVTFSYGREPVLEGVDLEIRAGEVVAFVGRTGAGKTTLADLLLRFHEPTSGRITLDGVDIRDIRRRSLHDLVAIVTQDPFLFGENIFENIRYGRPDATREDVERAARAANAHDFIAALPEGYDTPVGDFGSQLSGGQRQRVTIARAILCDPQILIFDEATSSLDAKAESQVQEAISNLMKGRTVLLIAHRLSTVKNADWIAIIEDHRISATGTHDELLARGGLYRELVKLQMSA